ncbi:sigma factor-like helix-turn-helix DNA-binding protein [Actinomadura geliboluensis]|uniref:sigma factor-like helix-turn-helix DNA-binding protein n=1 Tax=Actinomadura geliboluensis TaxID=882440 RepID=UPI003710B93A
MFVLREVFDLDYDEIAEAVDKTPAAVRQLAYRARAHVAALSDGGGIRHALLKPVIGADKVARLLAAGWWKRDAERTVEPVQINGGPGLLVRVDGNIDGVVAVRVENGFIIGAYHVRNPEKLSYVQRETTVSR